MIDSDGSWEICPCCGEDSLVTKSNVYGEWVECTECDYEGDQK